MNATPIFLQPKRELPFESISQRLNLQYDEIDANLDRVFADLFHDQVRQPESRGRSVLRPAALAAIVIDL